MRDWITFLQVIVAWNGAKCQHDVESTMSSTTSSKLRSFLVTSIPPNLYDSVNPMDVAWRMGLGFSSYDVI
jgi:hypothetical protein